jgi:hypothetical protein
LKLANTNGPCLAGPALIHGGSSGTTKRIQLGAAEQMADTALLTMTGNGGPTRLQMQGFNETIGGLESTASAGNMIVEAAGDNTADKPATLTLNVRNGHFQHVTIQAAIAIAPQTDVGSVVLEVINGSTASVITSTAFTRTVGAFSSVAGDDFIATSIKTQNFSLLSIQPLQST